MIIGIFKGKVIENMTRDELLEFAAWAASKIDELQKQIDFYGPPDIG